MNMQHARIVLRPRGALDSFDLAVRLLRSEFRTFGPLALAVLGPAAGLVFVGDALGLGGERVEPLAGEGLAWAFVRYSSDYVAEETAARTAKRGVWQAASEPPWEFRAERWAGAAQTAPRPDCPIKGNVNDEGERIYHTPWSPWYGKTKIDEAKGEAWFCDEAEALAAGWRPARFRG